VSVRRTSVGATRRSRRRAPDDDGFVLVMVAMAVVVIFGMVAIVIDLGQLRADHRENQKTADVAALAAGYFLSGRGSAPATPNPRAACAAAINSVVTDLPEFTPNMTGGAAGACAAYPVNALSGCATTPSDVVLTSNGYTLTVRYPIPTGEIQESRFQGGVGAEDGSNRCERMRVTLRSTRPTFFAGVFGVDEQSTDATTVVRANSRALTEGVSALLLLERMGCGVLQTSGGGTTGSGVVVRASSNTNPGVIQSDSAGQVGSGLCTVNENADGYVIYGTALPAAGGGGPSIKVEPALNGAEGIIAIRAIEVGGRGGAVVPTGLSPAPVGSNVNSRQVADNRYNRPVSAGGHEQITALHNSGRLLVTLTSPPSGYAHLTGAQCRNLNTTTDTTFATATRIFVQCDDFEPDLVVFPAATHLVFTGRISIPNNKFLSLPAAERVYVRGCPTCTGGRHAINVRGGGSELRINTVATGTAGDLSCASRPAPGADPPGAFTRWAVLATFDGPFISAGQVRLCQTFVYLGKNASPYARQSVDGTGVGSPSYPGIAGCAPTLPCPSDAGGDGYIDITGGGGTVDWSAPNQITLPPTQTDFATQPFEDLALWAEASSPSAIKGQGTNRTEGVYFLPNSSVTFTGQATQSQPLNAQFISRRLDISGQGSLFLRPAAEDAVPTRIPGALALIR
jgi:Flp pilus assembly protein TadG